MIDLRSDTVTTPSPEMREAMRNAEVGDDVYNEDPTALRLQEKAADLLGMEAALFMPSGTMANLCAILAQTRPGDTVIMSEHAHPCNYEGGNMALVAGVMSRLIPDSLGKITADQIAQRFVRTRDPHFSPTSLVCIENTTNRGGGACYEYSEMEEIGALCKARRLRLHCDGARLFNAVIHTNMEARFYASHCDTVSFCLSKGLGCPAGSLLCGSEKIIQRALRFRKMLGGGMRQIGILAAAGLYALDHHIEDLREDHRRASRFRRALEAEGLRFPLPSPTNIVYISVPDAQQATRDLEARGVLVLPTGRKRLRAVFHRDISDADLDQAITEFTAVLAS